MATTPATHITHPFFCTVPHMASRLISNGFTAEKTINPWQAERSAWAFQITPELCYAVKDYCTQYNYRLPKIIERKLNALENGGEV